MKTHAKHLFSAIMLVALITFNACKDDEPAPENNAPTLQIGDDIIGRTGTASNITIAATDPDGDPLDITWTIIESPAGSAPVLTNTSATNAAFNTNTAGLYRIEIEVEDSRGALVSGIKKLYIGGVLPTSISTNTTYPDLFEEEFIPDYYAPSSIQATAGVTLGAGVVIEFGADVRFWMNGNAAYLNAEGTSSKKIILRGSDQVKGSWRGLSFTSNNVNNKLIHVNLLHAGSSVMGGQKTAVHIQSNVTARVIIQQTSITQTAGYGVFIDGNGGLIPEYSGNTISNNDAAPIRLGAGGITSLDKNSTYANNGTQAIEVAAAGNTNVRFENGGTIPALPIPYHWYSSAELRSNVTFEAGATSLFNAGLRLWVTDEGALIADGTAANKITFSALTQSAGSWEGIEIASPSNLNKINQGVVSYGGNPSGRGANIYMFGSGAGSQLTLTNSTISNSQTYGLLTAAGTINLTQNGNTFSNNASGNIQQN